MGQSNPVTCVMLTVANFTLSANVTRGATLPIGSKKIKSHFNRFGWNEIAASNRTGPTAKFVEIR